MIAPDRGAAPAEGGGAPAIVLACLQTPGRHRRKGEGTMIRKTRVLGDSGVAVSTVGLGCMGMSEFYGTRLDEGEAVTLLHGALDLGVTHFDTAEMYGQGHNETLVGKAFGDRRDRVFIATKFGPLRDPRTGAFTGVDGSPANVRRAVEGSLQRLRTDVIDLYYLHRVDPNTPIEETVGAMARLVDEGKVRFLGLSEASAATLRRAHAVHPVTALQTEFSIFNREVETDVLPTCVELGISLVAYAPLGRGMLTGAFKAAAEVEREGDIRGQRMPQFSDENLAANLALVQQVEEVAQAVGAAPAQVALAWVLGRGDHVVAIPGTTRLEHLRTDLGALDVELDAEMEVVLDGLGARVRGARYGEQAMRMIDR